MRRAWLVDPQMMAYNARWNVNYPGYDPVNGCIDWPETQWSAFEARLQQPAERQGHFYVLDTTTGTSSVTPTIRSAPRPRQVSGSTSSSRCAAGALAGGSFASWST